MSFCVTFCMVALLFCGIFSPVQATDRDTVDLPQSSAKGQRVESGPANTHRLDESELQRFASLEDAIKTLPGFHVREEGGLGGYSELSFRGSDASAVDIYLDGMRLNQEGQNPDLAKWPLLWFSGVEARSGFDAFGAGDPGSLARIDLSTQSSDSSHAELRSRAASFSTVEGAATVHGGKVWKWTVGAEGQTAQNDYPFFTDNGTVYYNADDAWQRMNNNAYWSRGARASLRKDNFSFNQTLSVLWLDYLKEYPGIPNTVFNAQAYTRHNEWMGAYRIEAYPGHAEVGAGVQAHHFNDSYRDPGQSLGYASYEAARAATALEADLRASIPLMQKLVLGADTRVSHENVEPTATPYNRPFVSPSATRKEVQLGTALREKITRDLALTEDVRGSWVQFDASRISDFPNPDSIAATSRMLMPLSLRGGIQWRTPIGTFEALGRYEEQAPSSEELLGDNNGIRPNLKLDPQKTRTLSLSHDFRKNVFQFQTTAYWHRYEDPIHLQAYGASPFLQYGNGPAYRAVGVEAENRIGFSHFESRTSLTLQSLRILGGPAAGYWPAYQSPVEGHVEMFWKSKFHAVAITTGPMLDFQGPYYSGDINLADTRRSSQEDWGFHLDARQGRSSLGFDARNLLNNQYRDFAYSIRSGRNYSITLSINL